jgi:hypothetical protein
MLPTTAMMAKTVWTETRTHYLRQTNLVRQNPIPEKPMSISNNWQNCKLPQHLCKSKFLWKFFYSSYTGHQHWLAFFYKVIHPLIRSCCRFFKGILICISFLISWTVCYKLWKVFSEITLTYLTIRLSPKIRAPWKPSLSGHFSRSESLKYFFILQSVFDL